MPDEPVSKPESPERYLAGIDRHVRRRRRLLIAGVSVIALGVVLKLAPDFLIKRASQSYIACSNRDYEQGPDPNTDCKSAALWLGLPKLVPWKRKAALAEERSIERNSTERALKLATAFKPDAKAREHAANGLISLERKSAIDSKGSFALLSLAGAREELTGLRALATTSGDQNLALQSLLVLGRIDEAKDYARAPPAIESEDYEAREYYFRRGALLCLLGEREIGLARLQDAERVHKSHHDFPYYEARIARAACSGEIQPSGDDLDRDALWSFELGERLSGTKLEEKLIGEWSATSTIRDGSESPFVAAAIAERERPLEQTLALLGALSRFPFIGLNLAPWVQNSASAGWLTSYPLLLDPERHEKAAARLETLAKTAPKELPKWKESDRGTRWMPATTEKRYIEIRKEPATSLVRFAAGFELEAASAWSAQGACDRAEKAAERALILNKTPDAHVFVTSLTMRCARFDHAREIAERGLQTAEPGLTRAILLLLDAELLAHAGKFSDALAKAREANALAEKLRDKAASVWAATNWLVLALGLAAGDLSGVPELLTPGLDEVDKIPWQRLITMPERERAPIRWRLRTQDPNPDLLALPAEIYVIGEAVRGAGEVEVWLDLELGLFDRRLGSAAGLAARAEAARWRADPQAERTYLERAELLRKLGSDPKKRALATLLGL